MRLSTYSKSNLYYSFRLSIFFVLFPLSLWLLFYIFLLIKPLSLYFCKSWQRPKERKTKKKREKVPLVCAICLLFNDPTHLMPEYKRIGAWRWNSFKNKRKQKKTRERERENEEFADIKKKSMFNARRSMHDVPIRRGSKKHH